MPGLRNCYDPLGIAFQLSFGFHKPFFEKNGAFAPWECLAAADASIGIQHASELTDGEIGKLMRQSGMVEGKFIVNESIANGCGEGVFVDYAG